MTCQKKRRAHKCYSSRTVGAELTPVTFKVLPEPVSSMFLISVYVACMFMINLELFGQVKGEVSGWNIVKRFG